MAQIVVLGAGIGGTPAVFELRKKLGAGHRITLINAVDYFQFIPSNPWVLVGWRTPQKVSVPLAKPLRKRDIELVVGTASAIHADARTVELSDGRTVPYDYLLVTTGAKLAFDEVPGLGPQAFTQSVCTLDHASQAWEKYQEFLKNPGPIVVGAVQGASCFGPAYETALIIDADLRKRRLRDKVPMTFVSSEPYVGHLGLGGVGDSKGMLESKLREHSISFIVNARVKEVRQGEMVVIEHGADGQAAGERTIPQVFSMLIPAFKGVDAVAGVPELCNPRGFVFVDEHQKSKKYPNIYSAGVCIAIAPKEPTPVPTGVPKTGYMIESMVSAAVDNIKAEIEGRPPEALASWNAICLADFGDSGMAFVAIPQIPPRNVTWTREGRWVHLAKIGFEKYFMGKMRSGVSEHVYERWTLDRLGIDRIKA
ncbi:MAG TPA: FAD-dependent oxidoreductase [Rectinemataceae bacterium]|nr:FAD-dependent oxidoreductase [Rectinemataceae bacterium]